MTKPVYYINCYYDDDLNMWCVRWFTGHTMCQLYSRDFKTKAAALKYHAKVVAEFKAMKLGIPVKSRIQK